MRIEIKFSLENFINFPLMLFLFLFWYSLVLYKNKNKNVKQILKPLCELIKHTGGEEYRILTFLLKQTREK